MPKVPYPYKVNGKLVTRIRNGSLIHTISLSNRSLLPSLTVLGVGHTYLVYDVSKCQGVQETKEEKLICVTICLENKSVSDMYW